MHKKKDYKRVLNKNIPIYFVNFKLSNYSKIIFANSVSLVKKIIIICTYEKYITNIIRGIIKITEY